MSYELYAREYERLPNVTRVSVWPLDTYGQPVGPMIEDVAAVKGDEVGEMITAGGSLGVGGVLRRWVIFAATLQTAESDTTPVMLAPQAVIQEADGTRWTIERARRAVFDSRWICECSLEVAGG